LPVATVALLALFARSIDWRHAWSAIVHADPMLLVVATAANHASLAVKGVRWWLFLDAIGVRGIGVAVRATVAGAALNNVLVANGGDAARVAAMARHGNVSSASVLATLAVDRFSDLVTYAVLFVVAALTLALPTEIAKWRTPGIVAFVVVGIVLVLALVKGQATPAAASSGAKANPSTLLGRARAYGRLLIATSASVATRSRLALAIGLALIAWAGQWATFHYAAHAAAFPATAATSLIALLVVNASFLVRLTPGNVGVFQLLYALATTSAGLDKDGAVAVAFLIQLVQYIPVTIIGLLLAPAFASRVSDGPPLVDPDQHMRVSAKRGT
jgi:uncharacterized protein (TIRG00374 family)